MSRPFDSRPLRSTRGRSLRASRASTNGNGARPHARVEPIAIIGMRGRFPGASDLDTYWRNLADGVESIEVLSEEDMRAAGIPDHVSRLPGYVNASPVLDRIDEFDAEFFGFSARDASLTDPQHLQAFGIRVVAWIDKVRSTPPHSSGRYEV